MTARANCRSSSADIGGRPAAASSRRCRARTSATSSRRRRTSIWSSIGSPPAPVVSTPCAARWRASRQRTDRLDELPRGAHEQRAVDARGPRGRRRRRPHFWSTPTVPSTGTSARRAPSRRSRSRTARGVSRLGRRRRRRSAGIGRMPPSTVASQRSRSRRCAYPSIVRAHDEHAARPSPATSGSDRAVRRRAGRRRRRPCPGAARSTLAERRPHRTHAGDLLGPAARRTRPAARRRSTCRCGSRRLRRRAGPRRRARAGRVRGRAAVPSGAGDHSATSPPAGSASTRTTSLRPDRREHARRRGDAGRALRRGERDEHVSRPRRSACRARRGSTDRSPVGGDGGDLRAPSPLSTMNVTNVVPDDAAARRRSSRVELTRAVAHEHGARRRRPPGRAGRRRRAGGRWPASARRRAPRRRRPAPGCSGCVVGEHRRVEQLALDQRDARVLADHLVLVAGRDEERALGGDRRRWRGRRR